MNAMVCISIDMAARICTLSKRTLWRRVSEGRLSRRAEDARGRALLNMNELAVLAREFWSRDEMERIAEADAGDPSAMADVGAMLYLRARYGQAVSLFELAAAARSADACHWLCICYAKGAGVEKSERMAVKWLRTAASLGHAIAAEQLLALGDAQDPITRDSEPRARKTA